MDQLPTEAIVDTFSGYSFAVHLVQRPKYFYGHTGFLLFHKVEILGEYSPAEQRRKVSGLLQRELLGVNVFD